MRHGCHLRGPALAHPDWPSWSSELRHLLALSILLLGVVSLGAL